MPRRRRYPKVRPTPRITRAAVEAFLSNDYHRLHDLLDLDPWEPSPIHWDTGVLGIDPDCPPHPSSNLLWDQAWPKVMALRLALIAEAAKLGRKPVK